MTASNHETDRDIVHERDERRAILWCAILDEDKARDLSDEEAWGIACTREANQRREAGHQYSTADVNRAMERIRAADRGDGG